MTWVWKYPRENAEFGADFDYHASLPISGGAFYNAKHIDPALRPVYKSRTGLKKFKKLHCPPLEDSVAIDPEKSDITSKTQKPDRLIIGAVRTFVHIPGCLGKLHLARDARMDAHLLVSDDLKEALSATGQDSPFYRLEDVPTLNNIGSRL